MSAGKQLLGNVGMGLKHGMGPLGLACYLKEGRTFKHLCSCDVSYLDHKSEIRQGG